MSYCGLCVCLRILMSSSSTLPPVVCRRAHVLLCFVCMFTYIDVQHFPVAHLFSFLCFVFCFVCLVLCRMCLLLPISLDCPFLISISGFSNVYLAYQNSVSEWLQLSAKSAIFQLYHGENKLIFMRCFVLDQHAQLDFLNH